MQYHWQDLVSSSLRASEKGTAVFNSRDRENWWGENAWGADYISKLATEPTVLGLLIVRAEKNLDSLQQTKMKIQCEIRSKDLINWKNSFEHSADCIHFAQSFDWCVFEIVFVDFIEVKMFWGCFVCRSWEIGENRGPLQIVCERHILFHRAKANELIERGELFC